jgi:bacterioferritin-associated ferredoxin
MLLQVIRILPGHPMIVCCCRRIRDQEIAAAVASGARRCADVFQARGTTPQCGQCATYIKAVIAASCSRAAPHAAGD